MDNKQIKARLAGVAQALGDIGKQAIEEWKKGISTTQELMEIYAHLIHTYTMLATLIDKYDAVCSKRHIKKLMTQGMQILRQPAEREPWFESFVKEAGGILGMGSVITHRAHKGARPVSRSVDSLNLH